MQQEVNSTQKLQEQDTQVIDEPSVCTTAEETERLLKLFQLFITIDKRIKKEIYETTNNRNTDNSSKTE